ncbi:MAG: T9SS type A sorting domain-containing protein [bacterium]
MKKIIFPLLGFLIFFNNISEAQKSISLTHYQAPELRVKSLNDVIFSGDPVQLGTSEMVSGGNGQYVYYWYPENGLDDPSSPRPWASPVDDITYTLTVTDEANCSQTTAQKVTVDRTGTNNLKYQPEIHVYPNPANKQLHISAKFASAVQSVRISLFTVTGKKVLAEKYNIQTKDYEFTLDLEHLDKGLYMLVVFSDNFLAKEQVVIY